MTDPELQFASPSLLGAVNRVVPAYEYKFVIDAESAVGVLERARQVMHCDPYADPDLDGCYWVHTTYMDTKRLDVLQRKPGFRRDKYRVRRYGDGDTIFIERKSRIGNRVRKRRVAVNGLDTSLHPDGLYSLDGEADWFARDLQRCKLRPTAAVHYLRSAFVLDTERGRLRLTVDSKLVGHCHSDWLPPYDPQGSPLLEASRVLELKFTGTVPPLFRDFMREFELKCRSVSKYRIGGASCGILPGRSVANAGFTLA